MTKKPTIPGDAAKLRKMAEKKLVTKLNKPVDDKQRQLHELMIHQIELEMQNEELNRMRIEADISLENYTRLYDFAPIPYLTLDADSTITNANNAASNIFGKKTTDLYGKRLGVFVSENSKPLFNECIKQAFSSQKPETCEISLQIKDCFCWFILTAIADKQPNHILVAAVDITERKRAEEQLQLASIVYQSLNESIMVIDQNNTIIAINPAFTKLTGYPSSEAIGKNLQLLFADQPDEHLYPEVLQALNTKGMWEGELFNHRNNSDIYYYEQLKINNVTDPKGKVLWRIASFFDNTEQRIASETIQRHANFDLLTGLPNRRLFQDRLQQAIKKAQRSNQKFALMFLDIDLFKNINDTFGHTMGDILLKDAALRLNSCIRATDTIARSGGDEFTIIVDELSDLAHIERIASSILKTMKVPFQLGTDKGYVSVSIGIAIFPDDASDSNELMKKADQAMYIAKNRGRNCRCYFTPVIQENIQRRLNIAKYLQTAIETQQLYIEYQPIVHLTSGRIHIAEVLLRWQHPEYGVISPAEFVPIAEQTGIIRDIDNWVFQQVVQKAKKWRTLFDKDFQVSINISSIHFNNDDNLLTSWLNLMETMKLAPKSIIVEITSARLKDGRQETADYLLKFQENNLDIALDNFGYGYSSLSCLNEFSIDFLKIDRNLVSDIASGTNDFSFCEAMILMIKKLGIQVMAVGVETTKQRELLLAAGCDYGQGYLFSRPVSADEFEQILQDLRKTPNRFVKRNL
jgi:diguanylate cyclase (GGDEF)-like protein/PAS domain S-box-containing protein